MTETIKKYEEIIERITDSITQAERYKEHLNTLYNTVSNNLDDVIKIQSMVLKIDDYISQKHMSKVELERQLIDLKADIKKA